MALPARAGMRVLSQRLRYLSSPIRTSSCINAAGIRLASRYSSPHQQPRIYRVENEDGREDIPMSEEMLLKAQQAKKDSEYSSGFLLTGLVLSWIGLGWTCYEISKVEAANAATVKLDSSSEATAKFQGKEVHVIGVGEGKRIVAEDGSGVIDLVETGTSSVPHFPKVIYLPTAAEPDATDIAALVTPGIPANMEQYTLLGLGIRSVSFLSIQVYVMGMYVRTTDLTSLQAKLIHTVNPAASTLIPSEKDDLLARLLDAEQSQEIWGSLLQTPGIKSAWRIAPTRNTDFMHLRDGWITGINKRTAQAKKLGGNVPSEYDREDFGMSVRSFMSLFKGGKAPKGSVMVLARTNDGGLSVLFQEKPDGKGPEKEMQVLGEIGDERIGKLIWLNYLAGGKVSSEPARKGVAEGCVALASRPVGSAESMVA